MNPFEYQIPTTTTKMNRGFRSKYMSSSDEFPVHLHCWLRIHKDGRCERLIGNDSIPAGEDPLTGVQSKDVFFSLKSNVYVRIYIPKTMPRNSKLPTLIYIHGGGFMTNSTTSSNYHPTLNLITVESNVVVVSVNYRLAPEYPLPIAYEDSWEAIKWVATHVNGDGQESWLNDSADLENVFFAGDSSGANVAHNMAIRVGLNPIKVINLNGLFLLQPYFGGKDPIGSEVEEHKEHKEFSDQIWKLATQSKIELDDPLFNPAKDPSISHLGCSRILVCVGEKDKLRDRGLNYTKVMENSGWAGYVEVFESKGEGHGFFLENTSSENARNLRNRISAFINPDNPIRSTF